MLFQKRPLARPMARKGSAVFIVSCFATWVQANPAGYTYSSYGTPGLIDMPTAEVADDAELGVTYSSSAAANRATLTFQLAPRLSGSFRYSMIENWTGGGALYDRSFDLRYQLVDERAVMPAIAVGFQDFIGTGVYSGEYIAATKHFGSALAVTAGMGWGRLGSYKGFKNPLGALDRRFETRPQSSANTGGQIESAKWFRGDAALFGGVAWRATEKLTLKAEYSSDAYARETGVSGLFQHKSPLNFGIDYAYRPDLHLQAYALHGSAIGFNLNMRINPRKPSVCGGTAGAPLPVMPRAAGASADLGWVTDADQAPAIRQRLADLLARDGMQLEGLALAPTVATVHIRVQRYLNRPQAIGRTARILTYVLPASVETLRIVPVENGMPTAAVTLQRSHVEQFEHDPDGAWRMFATADISDGATDAAAATTAPGLYPRLRWSLGPSVKGSFFDPDNPVRLDLNAGLLAAYDIAPGLTLSGQVQHRIVGNRNESTRFDPSALPRVRSDANIYNKADTALSDLTLGYYFRPGEALYGRVTVGYLESMYADLSTEILWKPVNSRFALGAEVNRLRQRNFGQDLGLRDYQVTSGHLSAYYDWGRGYHTQLDLGRYLAGDWGGTLRLDREFANGWRVGAYATLTDVSASQFGEGSFDKGIMVSIPLDHVFGRPVGRKTEALLQPILRDGGARVKVDGRLYEKVRSYHQPEMRKQWGRFWR